MRTIISIAFWVVIGMIAIVRATYLFNLRNRYHQLTIYRRKKLDLNRDVRLEEMTPQFVWMCLCEMTMFFITVPGLATSQAVLFMAILLTGFVPSYKKWWYYTREILVFALYVAAIVNRYMHIVALPTIM